MRALAIGEERKIHWVGPMVPVVGDVLVTNTGRRYLVRQIGGKRTLHCVVVPHTVKPTRTMRWMSRWPR